MVWRARSRAEFVIAAVEMRLSAAGLGRRKFDLHAEPSQQTHRRQADLGKQGVAQTCHHQRHFHNSRLLSCSRPLWTNRTARSAMALK